MIKYQAIWMTAGGDHHKGERRLFDQAKAELLGEIGRRLQASNTLTDDYRQWLINSAQRIQQADNAIDFESEDYGESFTLKQEVNHTYIEQWRLLTKADREDIVEWLQWNDKNGVFSDDVRIAEGVDPLTLEEARVELQWQTTPFMTFQEFMDTEVYIEDSGSSAHPAAEYYQHAHGPIYGYFAYGHWYTVEVNEPDGVPVYEVSLSTNQDGAVSKNRREVARALWEWINEEAAFCVIYTSAPITTPLEARTYIHALTICGYAYHLEDSAHDCLSGTDLSFAEMTKIQHAAEEILDLDWTFTNTSPFEELREAERLYS